ncbi:MAG: 4-hydroxy-3-methylbut-2-enyl diphosphate reductase [bacterium]
MARVSGFCFGVERVVQMTEKASKNQPVDTLGPIIHNPFVVKEFEDKGVRAVMALNETDKTAVIVRAHGVPPAFYDEARQRGIKLLDGTCPFVKDVQHAAEKLYKEGYEVVIVGKKDHPEVKGVLGYVSGDAHVVGSAEEAQALKITKEKVGVVVQTTFRYDIFSQCVDALMHKAPEVRVFNTRCEDTDQRQIAAEELASEVHVMIVVGGKDSSNTHKLWELAMKKGARAYHIESAAELDPAWFNGVEEVGVVGGASTPHSIVQAVVSRIESF